MNQPKRLPPFVPMLIETWKHPAWRAMAPAARCLYLALKRTYNSKHNNNGDIFLSQREAAKELNFSRPTVAKSFQELEHYGFIVMTSPGCLGVEGKGKSPHWRLTELETATEPPTMDFKFWDGIRFQRQKRSQTRARSALLTLAEQASLAAARPRAVEMNGRCDSATRSRRRPA
jgi:DNA-binding transcriptional MocR family regulator